MVKKVFLLAGIILLLGCEKQFHNLKLKRVPYTGNELRIDGYYYSEEDNNGDHSIAVFFRNGICIYTYTDSENIEKDILLNKSLINRFRNEPNHFGVFYINGTSLEFEEWENGRDIITFSNFCKILNDTTFLRTKYRNNQSGDSYSEKLLFHFKKFSPKPDSICKFIP